MNKMDSINKLLSKDRIAELKYAFDLFDEDGGGTISIEELATIFKSIGYNPSVQELRDMLNDDDREEEEDEEGKNNLTFQEFLKLMSNKTKDEDTKKELIEAFRMLDRDGQGLINITELKETMLELGEKLSPDELEILLRAADDDNDGYIEYEIFIDRIMN
jgi:Ca2+-binding EF-hand superfamily protein